ncbi:MAG: hypothetical protein HRT57_09480, partial [Crocinitomicaceae bacterium]|nr:hypothetical protein [Crocinitomicaceae bacterium]
MKNIYLILSVIVLSFGLSNQAHASHAMGMDLSYIHISGDTYQITLSFYRDCSGVNVDNTATIYITSPSGCGAAGSIVLTQIANTGNDVTPLCPSAFSTCNLGLIQGVEQYIYQGQYTMPADCDDWILSFYECARNPSITSIIVPGSMCLYVEATLDNTGSINNNSPQFTTLPVPYICVGQEFNYNHGAYDPDGDSLVYTLVAALDTSGFAVTYIPPNNPTYPVLDISGSIIFDSQTGSIVITPSLIQVAVIAIRVDEYRNGVKIGSVVRDLQIVVQNCSNVPPNEAVIGISNLTEGNLIDSNSIEACPGDNISFDLVFEDGNVGDDVTLTSNLGTVIPGATFTITGTNPVTGTVTWTPLGTDAGFHNFMVTVQDNGCPLLGTQVFAYDILVHEGTTAGPDMTFCPGGIVPQIFASGGSVFNWTVLSGEAINIGTNFTCTPC